MKQLKPDVLITFAFTENGLANYTLAEKSIEFARFNNLPMFTQEDISKKIECTSVKILNNHDQLYIRESDSYLSTLGLIHGLKKVAEERNWNNVVVAAAPVHCWRCVRDLRKMGFHVLGCLNVGIRTNKYWFNDNDPQIWVRNSLFWYIRESILRLLPWRVYSKIAG